MAQMSKLPFNPPNSMLKSLKFLVNQHTFIWKEKALPFKTFVKIFEIVCSSIFTVWQI